MLTAGGQTRVEQNLDLVAPLVAWTLREYHRNPTREERQDLACEASKALVEAADRWPDYCDGHSYDVDSREWFRIYATRRIKGALIDFWRRESPLTQRQIRRSTYALKHGVEESATKYGVSVEAVQEALVAREMLLVTSEMSDTDTQAAAPMVESSDWGALHPMIAGMPLLARVWIALVYVRGVPAKQARALLGLHDHADISALRGYVEFRLVSAVLEGAVG